MNLRTTTPLLLFSFILFLGCASALKAERVNSDLARDWKFIKQDVDPAAPTRNWEAVTIPHTWNNLDAQQGAIGNPTIAGDYLRGACWYARILDVPSAWNVKRTFIHFEARQIRHRQEIYGKQ